MSSDNSEDEVTPPSSLYQLTWKLQLLFGERLYSSTSYMCPCRVFSCTCTGQNEQSMCIAYIVVERVSG